MQNKNNSAGIIGKIVKIEISHIKGNDAYSLLHVEVIRRSGRTDTVQVIAKNLDSKYQAGQTIYVFGTYRSRNINHKVTLYLYADQIDLASEDNQNLNDIVLTGYICKNNGYRRIGIKDKTDAILAVRRAYGIKDYIPCVFWGINACFASVMQEGDKVTVYGRIQSREYPKLEDGKYITKIAYEVSVKEFDAKLPER